MFMKILTDEQYINMADTLGILDVNQMDSNFSLTKEDAWNIIDNWFNSEENSYNTLKNDDKKVMKAKIQMANELFKRCSKKIKD